MTDFFLSCKESKMESPRNYYGSFYLGPFNGSQSLTVANALRRTLLSELKGIAITSVIIHGANHEFSTLPGIRESVLDILLNFKEIVLKTNSVLKKTQIGYLQVHGPGVVRASDLKLPAFIHCVDPDQYIATLSQDGTLIMKFTINQGKNYIVHNPPGLSTGFSSNTDKKRLTGGSTNLNVNQNPNFQNQGFNSKFKLANEVPMLLDAVFMPVNKANYFIETYSHSPAMSLSNSNAKELDFFQIKEKEQEKFLDLPAFKTVPGISGPYSDLNSNLQVIVFEIWTNGSIHPRKAMYQGLNHLMNLFSQLEKIQILNSTFTKTIESSNYYYQKMFKKMEYEYEHYTELENVWRKKSKSENELSPEAFLAFKEKYIKELISKADLKNFPVSNLNISNRSRNLLESSKIFNVFDLVNYSPKKLRQIKGLGEKCLQEVQNAVQEIGFELKKD